MRLLSNYLALDGANRLMVARALALVGVVRIALALLPYGTVQRVLERTVPLGGIRFASVEEKRRYGLRVISSVQAVAKNLLGDKPCLTQALVAQWLLRRGGIEADLRIGVAFGEERELKAHAWLEQQGRVIMGGYSSPKDYAPLTSVEAKAA